MVDWKKLNENQSTSPLLYFSNGLSLEQSVEGT